MRRRRQEPSLLTEQELVAAARAGSTDAFGELFERYRPGVVQYLRLRVRGDVCRAEDLAQDTFVKALAHIGGLRDDACFRSWLYAIALRTLLTSERSLKRHPTASIDWMVEGPTTDRRLTCMSAPIEEYADRELLIEAFRSLAPDLQRAFILRHVDGYSNPEIAEIEGVTVSAAQARAHRASRKIGIQLDALIQQSERQLVEVGSR